MYKWMQMGIIRTARIHHIHRTALTARTLPTTLVGSNRVRGNLNLDATDIVL